MPKRAFTIGIIVVLTSAFSSVGETAAPQTLSGIVVTADGSVLPKVKVQAQPIGDVGTVGTLSWTPTDKEGRFQISLEPGRYRIRAKAEDDGYPDPSFLLSSDPSATFPDVLVSDSRISDVRVVLGSKGGVLEGEVRDGETGRAIAKAKVTISDANDPKAYVEVFTDRTGQFHFTVPPKPIAIRATAAGYVPASFNSGDGVKLSGGERRSVTIDLETGPAARR